MNNTDFRTMSDKRLQLELERRLVARRLDDAKRAQKFGARRVREADRAKRFAKPPEPVQMCAVEDVPAAVSAWIRWPVMIAFVAVLALAFYELAMVALKVAS